MSTLEIDSTVFNVYADIGEADVYALGSMNATAWNAASDTSKATALVTATRLLDRQLWGSDCDTFEKREDNDNIQYAAIELAFALVAGSPVQDEQSTAQKIKSLKAGSVALEYFRGAEGEPLRFPLAVMEYLRASGCYGSTSSEFVVYSSGTDGETVSDDDFGFSEAP